MPAYVIVDVDVLDPEEFARYAELVPPTVAPVRRPLPRARRADRFARRANRRAERVVILEFPTLERAREWGRRPSTPPARAIRRRAARVRMVAVEGVSASK